LLARLLLLEVRQLTGALVLRVKYMWPIGLSAELEISPWTEMSGEIFGEEVRGFCQSASLTVKVLRSGMRFECELLQSFKFTVVSPQFGTPPPGGRV